MRHHPVHGANISCSFCGKGQKEVRKLIAGPGVYICDECIRLCDAILGEELARERQEKASETLPQAMAARLIKACEADPRVPQIITDLAVALAVALEKHLNPPKG